MVTEIRIIPDLQPGDQVVCLKADGTTVVLPIEATHWEWDRRGILPMKTARIRLVGTDRWSTWSGPGDAAQVVVSMPAADTSPAVKRTRTDAGGMLQELVRSDNA